MYQFNSLAINWISSVAFTDRLKVCPSLGENTSTGFKISINKCKK